MLQLKKKKKQLDSPNTKVTQMNFGKKFKNSFIWVKKMESTNSDFSHDDISIFKNVCIN